MNDKRTTTAGACQSFVAGSQTCKDGFVQKAYCSGRAGCLHCGHIADSAVPDCLREEIPARLLRENGAPLFYEGLQS